MESTLTWTGMWTSIIVSGLLIIPVVLEFMKRNFPICLGLIITILTLYCLTPYSAGARQAWAPINKAQTGFHQAVQQWAGPSTEP